MVAFCFVVLHYLSLSGQAWAKLRSTDKRSGFELILYSWPLVTEVASHICLISSSSMGKWAVKFSSLNFRQNSSSGRASASRRTDSIPSLS